MNSVASVSLICDPEARKMCTDSNSQPLPQRPCTLVTVAKVVPADSSPVMSLRRFCLISLRLSMSNYLMKKPGGLQTRSLAQLLLQMSPHNCCSAGERLCLV
jgi:hypothetical protein